MHTVLQNLRTSLTLHPLRLFYEALGPFTKHPCDLSLAFCHIWHSTMYLRHRGSVLLSGGVRFFIELNWKWNLFVHTWGLDRSARCHLPLQSLLIDRLTKCFRKLDPLLYLRTTRPGANTGEPTGIAKWRTCCLKSLLLRQYSPSRVLSRFCLRIRSSTIVYDWLWW